MINVLVVDDEKGMLKTLSKFLENENYNVFTAEDAVAAGQMLGLHSIDIVLTDIILPHVSGLELLDTIRNNAPRAKVILMTGQPTLETATEAVRKGAFDYLAKPVLKPTLLKVIASATKLKILEDEKSRLIEINKDYHKKLESLIHDRTTELLESEEKFLSMFEEMPFAFAYQKIITDKYDNVTDFQFIKINRHFHEMFGLSRDDILEKMASEVLEHIPGNTNNWISDFGKLAKPKEKHSFIYHNPDSDKRYYTIIYSPQAKFFISIFIDLKNITDLS